MRACVADQSPATAVRASVECGKDAVTLPWRPTDMITPSDSIMHETIRRLSVGNGLVMRSRRTNPRGPAESADETLYAPTMGAAEVEWVSS